jgi:uncharacterized protein (DUF2252 family)
LQDALDPDGSRRDEHRADPVKCLGKIAWVGKARGTDVQAAGVGEGTAGFARVANERGDRIAAGEYAADDLAADAAGGADHRGGHRVCIASFSASAALWLLTSPLPRYVVIVVILGLDRLPGTGIQPWFSRATTCFRGAHHERMIRAAGVPNYVSAVVSHSPAARTAFGRALRESVPRDSLGEWLPTADREDPGEILAAQTAQRVPELAPLRYARMSESPFAFLRGAAAVMAADLATVPNTGIRVQACGDAHVNNFRFFASPERNLVFDINDFDETAPGPWEWDVARLCASLRVLTNQRGWNAEDGDAVVRAAARSYRRRLAEYATWTTLDLFYERTEIKQVIDKLPTQYRAEVRRDVRRARRKDHMRAVAKLTTVANGRRAFVEDPPLTVSLTRTAHELDEVHGLIESYRATLSDDRRLMFDRYRLLDVARKVVGVGSVGTRCWVGLFEGRDDPAGDLLVLQAKQAVQSVLERHVGASQFDQHGRRVVVGQRLIQAAGDVFLGWASGPESGNHYYVRQLWDAKGKSDPLLMKPRALARYSQLCGWILARSHARTGDAVQISGYLGKGTQWDDAIVSFAARYADTNQADHAALIDAVARGRKGLPQPTR